MSGGEQQRVAIARALVGASQAHPRRRADRRARFGHSHDIMQLLQEVNETGVTVVVVTHERDVAAMTRRIIRLKDGQVEHVNLELADV
jgi:putative ABC transport system ATP-binding protein